MQAGNLLANVTNPSRVILRRRMTAPVASSPATLQLFLPRSIPSTAIGVLTIGPLLCFRTQPASDPEGRAIHKAGDDQAIGRSRGGLSTKIHALVDALGNPIGFYLTGGEAHDLIGADHLLPSMQADILIGDKAFDADQRVLLPLAAAGKTAVIPPKANRQIPRHYDCDLYKARHLIENFFAKLKQFRAIATRYDKTSRNFLAAIHLAASVIWLN
jgi:transposase